MVTKYILNLQIFHLVFKSAEKEIKLNIFTLKTGVSCRGKAIYLYPVNSYINRETYML